MLKLFGKIENPDHPLLGPTLWGLQRWTLWRPNPNVSAFRNNLIHILGTTFVISQYVELWLLRSNMEHALRNLSVTMLSTICVIKAILFIRWHNKWKCVIEYVSRLEKRQISKQDKVTDSIIQQYTRYSRNVTYFYWCLVTATVFTVILAPLFGYLSSKENRYLINNGTLPCPEILSSWLPFDKTRGVGYWVMVLEHAAICFYGGGVVASFDGNAVVLMTFFTGQLKLLSVNCERLFGDGTEKLSYDVVIRRIRDCHSHHVDLIKFSSILSSLLSPIMFIYVIICSLMICASAIQITTDGVTNMQRIWIAEYLLALIAQLFIYCWHGNEVLYMSDKLDEGVYASAWWTQDVRIRRSVLLLGGQLRRSIVFKAGPFSNLTLATFVTILKGSYSYYTLLSKKEE